MNEDSKRQPRSILPLNMIVSDVVHRKSNSINCPSASSKEGPKTISREVAQLLKIKNTMYRPKTSKPDKILSMLHEKTSKIYPHLVQQNVEKERIQPDNSRISLPSHLSTPLRRQCENFSQIYEGHHYNSEQQIVNRDLQKENISEYILSPVRQYNASQTSQPSLIDNTPMFSYQSNEKPFTLPYADLSPRSSSSDFLRPYQINYASTVSSDNCKRNEGFVFKPVSGNIKSCSFKEMAAHLEEPDQGEGLFSECSSDSASCIESTSSGDGAMVKHTTIEEISVTYVAEPMKKKHPYFVREE